MLSHQDIDELLQLSDNLVEEHLKEHRFLFSISDGLAYILHHSENREPYTINVFER